MNSIEHIESLSPRMHVFAVGCVVDLYVCALLQLLTIHTIICCRVRILPCVYMQMEVMHPCVCRQRQRHALTACCARAQVAEAQL